jgi:hypothetical protein
LEDGTTSVDDVFDTDASEEDDSEELSLLLLSEEVA